MIGTFPRLWLCTTATDMRRQFDGLVTLVKQQMALDPLSGQAFIFINRRRTMIKVLYFEPGGYCLWSKRLEQGQFAFLDEAGAGKSPLSQTEFLALIEGLDLQVKKRRKRWQNNGLAA